MNRIFKKEDPVVIWGDGSAIRDFAYADDVADGIILTLIKGTGNFDFLNLGSGNGYSIKELVETLCEIHKFNYKFDTSKDSGFPRRIMNIDNAKKILGFFPKYSLKKGLKETWSWYINNSSQSEKRHNYFKQMKSYSDWKIEETTLSGVKKIIPSNFQDHRGSYTETYNKEFMIENKINIDFLQDDISVSHRNVLRGIHGDTRTFKFVSCLFGSFQLIVVNNDPVSDQFKKWESFDISSDNRNQILIPPKFGNGHLVLSDFEHPMLFPS